MRKLTYFIATTADGFIAAADGSYDAFLQEGEHLGDIVAEYPETLPGHVRDLLGVTAGNRTFDAVLMGRATYEVGLPSGITSPYPHLEQHVFSSSMASNPDPAVQLVPANAVEHVRALKAREGRGICSAVAEGSRRSCSTRSTSWS